MLLGELTATRPDVFGHCQRVAAIAGEIARACPTLDTPCWEVERAALAHDIGKVAIPQSVLRKPSGLTPAERRLVQTHSAVGADLVSSLPVSANLVRLVRSHHERIDGTGYPDGLRGHQIPFEAQIIAVSDSWDAMTQPRSYREPLPFDRAADELRAHAGAQWRHDLVRLALEVLSARASGRPDQV